MYASLNENLIEMFCMSSLLLTVAFEEITDSVGSSGDSLRNA
eukprot:CAMPEP_0116887816 /NCGR_PEP_ID=MMETSP0463-20121206/22504_1 /TAXON_ID=181622 /ORGANISM="Strombidinopsis sp, Strain SopsisLIS2011" /LENGTH=41 /DNA_ID= /DNA_START= /DNA_END= /DNA_ORIENTATION=